jgi:hypothetical protein
MASSSSSTEAAASAEEEAPLVVTQDQTLGPEEPPVLTAQAVDRGPELVAAPAHVVEPAHWDSVGLLPLQLYCMEDPPEPVQAVEYAITFDTDWVEMGQVLGLAGGQSRGD